ncbi:MAG: NTP transferase domain-containing protein [Candidatus Thalassarchaeaceae archaeon]|nr:NTP transferase domain-containing protein [Candidatus Thalassarchaeaceae archaeon]
MVKQTVAEGAIILTGGPSSRMGEPKALIEIEGEAMLLRVVKALQKSGILQVILSFKNQEQATDVIQTLQQKNQNWPPNIDGNTLVMRIVFDEDLNQNQNSAVRGMSGAVKVAHQLGWETVQIVPCDVPFIRSQLFPLLYSNLSKSNDCAVIRSESGIEPLLFCAKTDALNTALNDINMAAHQVISKMGVVEVGPTDWKEAGITNHCFTNVNSKEDMEFLN